MRNKEEKIDEWEMLCESKWRVICGDALTILPIMPDRSVDMIFTDPPYGLMNLAGGDLTSTLKTSPVRDGRGVIGDGEADDIFAVFAVEAARLLKPGACLCCCAGTGFAASKRTVGKDIDPVPISVKWIPILVNTVGLKFKHMVIWDKGPMGIGWHYRSSYEVVLVAQKTGASCRWYDTSHRVENVIRHVRKVSQSKKYHPVEKPPALAAHFIELHSRPGHTVLDPFCGHGSTGVGAVALGRKFTGIDVDPTYCEMAIRSVSKATREDIEKYHK